MRQSINQSIKINSLLLKESTNRFIMNLAAGTNNDDDNDMTMHVVNGNL